MLRADRAGVRDSIQQVELLDTNGVNLVERVDNRNIAPTLRLDHVNQVVDCGVASDGHVRVRHSILVQYSLDLAVVDVRKWNRGGDIDTALVFLLQDNVW